MSQHALSEGTIAFKLGLARTSNPYHQASKEWMAWRDGYDQARAVAERPASLDDLLRAAQALKVA